ncbi:hypothetical protein WA158_004871 [Blastocystis sp. Blastoise]
MASNWDDWDDQSQKTSNSDDFFDDWTSGSNKARKPTRKQSFTDTWGDDDSNDASKNSNSLDDWDEQPKKTTKKADVFEDDWDSPSQHVNEPTFEDDWDTPTQPKKQQPKDDFDDEPVKRSPKTTSPATKSSPTAHTVRKVSRIQAKTTETVKKPKPTLAEMETQKYNIRSKKGRITHKEGEEDIQTHDQDASRSSKKPAARDDWSDGDDDAFVTTKKPVTSMNTNDLFDDDWSQPSQTASNSRGTKKISPNSHKSAVKEDSDDSWDTKSDNDDFDWDKEVTHKPVSEQSTTNDEWNTNSSSYYNNNNNNNTSRKNKVGLMDVFSKTIENPADIKRNLYTAGKVLFDSKDGLFTGLSNWVSNAVQSISTEGPLMIHGQPYAIKKKLGEGGFGSVYLVYKHTENDFSFNMNENKEYFALKKMIGSNQETIRDIEKEIKVLKDCKHPNILPLIDCDKQVNQDGIPEYYLLTPYYANDTVWSIIEYYNKEYTKIWPFTEKRCLTIFKDICLATQHMHAKGWCHRDIKPHNVMLYNDEKGRERAVLIDLGSAQPIHIEVKDRREANDLKEKCEKYCSAAYRAPELYDPMKVDGCVDIWSLGCTLYAMAFGMSPFESPIEGVMTLAILDGKVTFPANNTYHCCTYSKPFCKFIKMMLNPEYKERIDIEDILEKTDLLLERCN